MANHIRTRALWANDTDLLYTELDHLDAKTVDSLSSTGGVYSLTSSLTIGGAPGTAIVFNVPTALYDGVSVIGTLDVLGNLSVGSGYAIQFDSDVTLGAGTHLDINSSVTSIGTTGSDAFVVNASSQFQDVNFNGFTNFNNGVTFSADVTLDAGTHLDINSSVTSIGTTGSDAFVVNAFSQFNEVVTVNSTAYFNNNVEFDGEAYTSGAGYFKGRRRQRQAIGGDADASYAVTSYDHVHVPAGTLSVARNYTIDDTGAANGDRMEFSNHDTSFAISVKKPGGVLIGQIIGSSHLSCVVERIGGVWKIIRYSDYILH